MELDKMNNIVKRLHVDIFFILLILIIVVAFFSRLFYPDISLYVTPEYNGSDTTNFNIPIKHFLSQSLHSGTVPVWSAKMGTGFPVFAESQIGTFFLPNLILFGLLPFSVAFNIGYVVSIFLACSGMFVLMRYKKISGLGSLVGSLAFGFSGFFMGHINHYNMIQAASLLPWLMFAFVLYRERKQAILLLAFALLLSQQLFAGYGQITFISLLAVFTDSILQHAFPLNQIKKKKVFPIAKDVTALIIATVIGVLLSAVMVLTTREFMSAVVRPETYDVVRATVFSFPFKQFLGFLNPFILGTPKTGTFPGPEIYYGNFFWETVPYIGLVPLFLAIVYSVRSFREKRFRILGIFLLIFVILMLGKFSPAYFVYSIPPFNIFRVPSRFILPVLFALSLMAGYAADQYIPSLRRKLGSRKFLVIACCVVSLVVVDFFYQWYNYHPITKASEWLDDPEFAKSIKEDGNIGRVMTPQAGLEKADVYSKQGWKNAEDFYVAARNEMLPNMNLVWDISQFQAYSGLAHFRRHNLFEGILDFSTQERGKTKPEYLLDILNIGYVIFPQNKDIPYTDLVLMDSVDIKKYGKAYYLYKNQDVLPRARIYESYEVVESLNDLAKAFVEADSSSRKYAIVEEELSFESKDVTDSLPDANDDWITWVDESDTMISFEVDMKADGLFVLADMYDVNWHVIVDGHEKELIPVNLAQRGVVLNEGKHQVKFTYIPSAFHLGSRISLISHVIVLLILFRYAFQTLRARRSNVQ